MLAEVRSGQTVLADGTVAPARATRIGGVATGDVQGRYYEQASRGNIFSLQLVTSAAPTGGQQTNGAAGSTAQFALWNPSGSGKNLSLLKFVCNPISGTAPTSGLVHCVATAPTIATSVANPITCGNVGMAAASVARAVASAAGAAGTALTGCGTFIQYRAAAITQTVAAAVLATSMAPFVPGFDSIDGEIVLPPGWMWIPAWPSAGTLWLVSYAITWEEIPQ